MSRHHFSIRKSAIERALGLAAEPAAHSLNDQDGPSRKPQMNLEDAANKPQTPVLNKAYSLV